ncbi:MAG: hypothetical protein JWM31_1465, partial [Solirubrobacterales bacterium]|nr:hypothetical protein [Solirubrobacterales bacterium]
MRRGGGGASLRRRPAESDARTEPRLEDNVLALACEVAQFAVAAREPPSAAVASGGTRASPLRAKDSDAGGGHGKDRGEVGEAERMV